MRNALLTGVGRRGQVGEGVAARLAREGYTLLLVDRTPDGVEERAAELRSSGAIVHAYHADLSAEGEVADLFARIRSAHGSELSALVHLAGGFAVTGPVATTAVADWERQLTINLRTAFLVSRAAVPMLRPAKGSGVLVASESALPGSKVARVAAYAVAKTGVATLAVALSQEEAPNGVRFNAIAPAAIRTATNTADMGPDARYVEREDVAATVAWLLSDESRAVTGQVFRLAPH